MTIPAPSSHEPQFTESLNFKVSKRVKSRLVTQSERLEMTQASLSRLCLSLGLEAVERLAAQIEGGTVTPRR